MEGLQEVMGQRTGPAINSVLFTESMDRFLQVSLPLSITIRMIGLGFQNSIAAGVFGSDGWITYYAKIGCTDGMYWW